VIYSSSGAGNALISQLQDQVNVLNLAFLESNFSFYLAGVSRILNDDWFALDPPFNDTPSAEEESMKQALAVDPSHALNIYTLAPLSASPAWAWFPWLYSEDSYLHGVIVYYENLPGGASTNHNEGDIVVHEVGHYLGLYHTYQNGCNFPGDEVDDTPDELSPAPDCQFGRDSCPSTGSDPITNYMDATDDLCRDGFTTGQFTRMESITAQYKPSLGGTSIYFFADLTIPADRSWEFYSGTFRFASNTKITTTGSLQVIGTSANPVVFDSSGTVGPWDGIWIENSTANSSIDYCTIQNSEYGIRLNSTSGTVTVDHATITNTSLAFFAQYSSPFTVKNSSLENNAYGLYLRSFAVSGSMVILSNIIRFNSYHGLYLYDGADAFLGHNTITNNSSGNTQAGVFCITNSDPFIRQTDGVNYGYNIIQNNVGIGVHASNNSYPSLGINELNKTKYGYNDIHDNNGYEVDNRSGSTIMAERNYWSADHTNPTPPSDVYGSVDYVPALPESPSDETIANAPPSQKNSTDFSEAFALEIQDEFQAAADLYLQLLEGDANADNVGFGVSGLIRCYKALDRRQEIAQLMQ